MEENGSIVSGYGANATDPDGHSIRYSITAIDDNTGLDLAASDFSINSSGQISYSGTTALDLEAMTGNTVVLTVRARASDGTDTQAVTILFTDVDEFDVAFASSAPGSALTLDENTTGSLSGYTANATDADSTDGVAYSITGVAYETSGATPPVTISDFSISSSGEISVVAAGGFNFEDFADTIVLTVTATSDDGSTATQDVTFLPTNKNEAPRFTLDNVSFSVDETTSGPIFIPLIAPDPDTIDTVTYAITSGNGEGIFSLTSDGELSFVNASNEDNDGVYALGVTATDNNASGDSAGVMSDMMTLNITVNEIA